VLGSGLVIKHPVAIMRIISGIISNSFFISNLLLIVVRHINRAAGLIPFVQPPIVQAQSISGTSNLRLTGTSHRFS
jgi:hypothetical protein